MFRLFKVFGNVGDKLKCSSLKIFHNGLKLLELTIELKFGPELIKIKCVIFFVKKMGSIFEESDSLLIVFFYDIANTKTHKISWFFPDSNGLIEVIDIIINFVKLIIFFIF